MVSVITPCYNSENYISATIESVISQTYRDWEMIIVDDCSTDFSPKIIKEFAKRDSRIKYIKTASPSGSPTFPRNVGLAYAKGRYIAFLDSDDLWLPMKLEEQLGLFNDEKVAIVYSDYEKIKDSGERTGRIIKSHKEHTYRSLLYGNELGCLTVIIDTHKIGMFSFKKIGHEDYALWLSILKLGFCAKKYSSVTALYRVRSKSVSSNKLRAIRWVWNIYVNEEKLSYFYAVYYLFFDVAKSIIKYLK
ncbi:glycosyltransferase family 2 protein [uncultured Bacteroides sp.]|uniref:glycosyltransferase family 2 protein n=1 Tax=uncultured Bacteroides sp. TaxID=162156 RepID=UPI0025E2BA5B|nr:glycosyltransferase family 2 protein [uncultured Bacteroides sp.]